MFLWFGVEEGSCCKDDFRLSGSYVESYTGLGNERSDLTCIPRLTGVMGTVDVVGVKPLIGFISCSTVKRGRFWGEDEEGNIFTCDCPLFRVLAL